MLQKGGFTFKVCMNMQVPKGWNMPKALTVNYAKVVKGSSGLIQTSNICDLISLTITFTANRG